MSGNNTNTDLGSAIDYTNPYSEGWIGFQVLLAVAFCLSGLTYALSQFHPHLRKSFHANLLKFLCLQDFLWSSMCLIQCAINLHSGVYNGGGGGSSWPCQFQTAYMQFFIMMNGFTLCIMAYATERRVCLSERGYGVNQLPFSRFYHRWIQSPKSILFAHLVCYAISALFVLISNVVVQSPILEPSGTFCFLSLENKFNSVMLFVPLIGFAVFLIHRYRLIFSFVVQQNQNRSGLRNSASRNGNQGAGVNGRNSLSMVTPSAETHRNPQQQQIPNPQLTPPSRLNQQQQQQNQNQQNVAHQQHQQPSPNTLNSPNNPFAPPTPRSSIQLQTTQKNIAKRMVVFVMSYLVCSFPAALIAFSQLISNDFWLSSNPVAFLIAAHLMHANAIVNPVVYMWMNRQMRSELRKLFCDMRWRAVKMKEKKKLQLPPQTETQNRAIIRSNQVLPFKYGGGPAKMSHNSNSSRSSTLYRLQCFCCSIPMPVHWQQFIVGEESSSTSEEQNKNRDRNPQRPRAMSIDMLPSEMKQQPYQYQHQQQHHTNHLPKTDEALLKAFRQPKTGLAEIMGRLPPTRYTGIESIRGWDSSKMIARDDPHIKSKLEIVIEKDDYGLEYAHRNYINWNPPRDNNRIMVVAPHRLSLPDNWFPRSLIQMNVNRET